MSNSQAKGAQLMLFDVGKETPGIPNASSTMGCVQSASLKVTTAQMAPQINPMATLPEA